jgi:drug/metabolite transporter (DMT)-like permease
VACTGRCHSVWRQHTFSKQLIGNGSGLSFPFLLAGLLYLGSGLGLTITRLLRDRGWKPVGMPAHDWPRLLGAIVFGGVLGPLLLMVGLSHTTASTASLFLNLEAVLTATLAWMVFKESTDRRIVLGMVLIVAGGAVLAWPTGEATTSVLGPLALAGACRAWAIHNNLIRKVAASDALFIAGSKSLVVVGLGGLAASRGGQTP